MTILRLLTVFQLFSSVVSFTFQPKSSFLIPFKRSLSLHESKTAIMGSKLNHDHDELELSEKENNNYMLVMAPCLVAALMLPCESVLADAGSYGILAGRTASMLHPVSNIALFFTSLYSAYLGFQWRRLRDIGEELKVLNSQLPSISSGKLKSPVAATLATLSSNLQALQVDPTPEGLSQIDVIRQDIGIVTAAAELDSKISELSAARKDLLSMNLRDKHFASGSVLLGVGVSVSILGAFNTYMRAGRLFPGPHLYAGMAITILWAGNS